MNTSASSVVVYVTYHGTPQDRFDQDYYVEAHLPLVMKAWSQYGLLGVNGALPRHRNRKERLPSVSASFGMKAQLEAALRFTRSLRR